MGIRKRWSSFVWLLLAGAGAAVRRRGSAGEARPAPDPQTQLTLRLDPLQGRATVIAIAEQTLTIVTAAHFLVPGGRRENDPDPGGGPSAGTPGGRHAESRLPADPIADYRRAIDLRDPGRRYGDRPHQGRPPPRERAPRVCQDPLRRMDPGPRAEKLRPDPQRPHRGPARRGARRPGGQSPEPAMPRLGRSRVTTPSAAIREPAYS